MPEITPEYTRLREIWRSMKKRCHNPKCKDYPHYGAQGIHVCAEWRNDFNAFFDWAMSHGYRNDLTIDRVSNYRGYNPGNCRWISRKAQCSNRRTNTHYTIDGKTKTLKQWSETYGVPDFTIIHRLDAGWPLEDAIKKPVRKKKN